MNHVYRNNHTLRLADDFAKSFNNSIAEIHLSGFKTLHEPLFLTRQENFIKAIPKAGIPVVIESVLDSLDDAKKEFDYIQSIL